MSFITLASCALEQKVSALGNRELHKSNIKLLPHFLSSLSAVSDSLWHLRHLWCSLEKFPMSLFNLMAFFFFQWTLLSTKKKIQKQAWHNINWSLVIYVCFLSIQTNSIPFWIFYDACYSHYTWFISHTIFWIIPNADVFILKYFAEICIPLSLKGM